MLGYHLHCCYTVERHLLVLLKRGRRHAASEEKQEVELTPTQGCRVELTDHSSCHLRLGYAANPIQGQGAASEHE